MLSVDEFCAMLPPFSGEGWLDWEVKLSSVLRLSAGDPNLPHRVLSRLEGDAALAAEEVAAGPLVDYEKEAVDPSLATGIRIGIIAREDSDEAWRIAYERFPADRKGQITHQIAMKVSDSSWHTQLSQLAKLVSGEDNPYWLVPFENYKTFCPYLVGSYDRVGQEVARYFGLGYRTVILDVPSSPEEMQHIGRVFDLADELVLQ